MKKGYNYILILIMIFLVSIPIIKNNFKFVEIDGIFNEWNHIFSLKQDELLHNYKIDKDVKSVKYFRDDKYLYLYVEKYYYDSIWNIVINILEEEDNDIYVSNSLVLREAEGSNKLNLEYIESDYVQEDGLESYIVGNKVEVKIPLSILKQKYDEDNMMFEVLVGEKGYGEERGLSDVDVILNKGPALEKKQSIIFAIMILCIGLVFTVGGYNKNEIFMQ